MTRWLSTPALALVVTLALLNGLFMMIGFQRSSHPALAGFAGGCAERPCWYGIVAGETRLETALKLLEEQGWAVTRRDLLDYVRLEAEGPDGCTILTGGSIGLTRNPILESIPISDCHGLRLGDVLAEIGIPDRVSSCDRRFSVVPQFGGQVSVNLVRPKVNRQWLSPFDAVERIFITREAAFPIVLTWHGFAPAWRYQQLGDGACG